MIFWEALQFEATLPQLHTFHMDLHPPTHVQLKTPMVDVLRLSVVQISISIGNHLHIGINQKNKNKGYVAPKPRR